MTLTLARTRLERFGRLLLLRHLAMVALAAVAGGWSAYAWADYLGTAPLLSGMVVGLLAAAASVRWLWPVLPTRQQLTSLWHEQQPSLEDSLDLLWLPPEHLPLVQRLQQLRLLGEVARVPITMPWSQRTRQLGWAVMSVALLGLMPRLLPTLAITSVAPEPIASAGTRPPIASYTGQLQIVPPAYTSLPSRVTTDLDVQAPEGSTVRWLVAANELHPDAIVVRDQGKARFRKQKDGSAIAEWTLTRTGLYRLQWPDSVVATDAVHALEAIADHAPIARVTEPEAFIERPWAGAMRVAIAGSLSDDYGLTRALLHLTRSVGQGEGVRFEQINIPLTIQRSSRSAATVNTELDLRALKMSPGAELYGSLQVWDNRTPKAQMSASPSFLILVPDTAAESSDIDFSLAVKTAPAFFRSQRQIIIDIERLLARKATIPADTFTQLSNNIGIDQKLLRLRYGQFLGEEFETYGGEEAAAASEPTEHHDDADHDDGDHEDHDHAGHDHADHAGHDHAAHSPSPAGAAPAAFGAMRMEDIPGGLFHDHDNGSETSTYFPEAIRIQLKLALAQMWDSELRLRTIRPAEALPYAYKALYLLKEVQQKSRVYVRRLGYQLPTPKLEKRLTGELAKIKSKQWLLPEATADTWAPARLAIEQLSQRRLGALNQPERMKLEQVAQLLTVQAQARPLRFLPALTSLRRVVREPSCDSCLRELLAELTRVVPVAAPAGTAAQAASGSADPLEASYHNRLSTPR